MWGHPGRSGHGGESGRTWSPGEGNGKPLQDSCLENPVNSVKSKRIRHPSAPPQVSSLALSYRIWISDSASYFIEPRGLLETSSPGSHLTYLQGLRIQSQSHLFLLVSENEMSLLKSKIILVNVLQNPIPLSQWPHSFRHPLSWNWNPPSLQGSFSSDQRHNQISSIPKKSLLCVPWDRHSHTLQVGV